MATYATPISVAIVVLLAILALSYWQTITGYPNGAGSYIVASDNLGRMPGLVAAVVSAPIYPYLFGTAGVVGLGLWHWATGTLPPYMPPDTAQELVTHPAETFGVLLLLRAFSSGAVALTGVEGVSNGVAYFAPPETRNAHRTLLSMAVAFGAVFLGISFLSGAIGIIPDPTEVETVHSQLTRTLIGSGPAHAGVRTPLRRRAP